MIALKPWWVIARETGLGVLGFCLGVAVMAALLMAISSWDDRRFRVQCTIDTSRILVPFVLDTAGPARLAFWELRLTQPGRTR